MSIFLQIVQNVMKDITEHSMYFRIYFNKVIFDVKILFFFDFYYKIQFKNAYLFLKCDKKRFLLIACQLNLFYFTCMLQINNKFLGKI